MKILVTGADGLLAHALREGAPRWAELVLLRRTEFDLTNPEQMAARLKEHRPQAVINTAAYNWVDRCEIERDLSWAVNATGPERLARLCHDAGVRLVHYGTDYVFDGTKGAPYVEEDRPNPVNHYAAGKLAGERAVLLTTQPQPGRAGEGNAEREQRRSGSTAHLVLRVSWLFGWHPTQTKTYVHTVLSQARKGQTLKATTDQASVPTYVPELARWTYELIERGASGLFHAVNDEGLTRYEWTKAILAESERALNLPRVDVEPVTTAYFNPTMRRPAVTILSNAKLSRLLGCPMGSWRPGLRQMLEKMRG